MSADPLTAFVEALANTPAPPDVTNPYAHGDDGYNALRRANLLAYLRQMDALRPADMLVLEAPGYRGMRQTGVPASGHWLVKGVPGLGLFGLENGFQTVPEPELARYGSNQTGTALWSTLGTLGRAAMVWNAYPFHPHKPGNPLSNRTPRRREVLAGAPFLQMLLAHFAPARVIAVGNIADAALTLLDVPHDKVRHPAQGGYRQFVDGLTALMGGEAGAG